MQRTNPLYLLLLIPALAGCSEPDPPPDPNALFRPVPSGESGIDFSNDLTYTEEFNPYLFRNFFNGGGVGLGDINNDGLADVFFSGNQAPNRLYLNEGNLRFRDISEKAGIICPGIWSTGVSLVDLNADGWLDIYVCKSGPMGGERRHNELFINNGDLTFSERSKDYGLDFLGLSTHAAFFDYDKDGDLDCYLLNNSMRSVGANDYREGQREVPDPAGGNRLLRNDEGMFTDVSRQAGIYSSAIGYGLGVSVADLNDDGWLDFYVSNDFFEKDYLYINHKDGTFRESLEEYLREISLGSMGADIADISNDGLPEIFVTEMLPDQDRRLKTTAQFENWDRYRNSVRMGYYHQFSRNVLQLNNGDGTFSEIGRYAGVHATDWSWGALIFDADLDGWKDLFVANGIYKDLLDQDYVNFIADPGLVSEMIMTRKDVLKTLIDSIPSNRIANCAFRNRGDLTFENTSEAWGFTLPTHSNGSAYGDLDNDGDLDLVISNVNMPALIYENRSRQLHPEANFITVNLEGTGQNLQAIGAKVAIYAGGSRQTQELSPARGFMSSVESGLVFGVGRAGMADSIVVTWPDRGKSVLRELAAGQVVNIRQGDPALHYRRTEQREEGDIRPVFTRSELPEGLEFRHQENAHSDFDRDRLLFHMVSNEGPCLCTGDADGDGLQDFYIGGAKGQGGRLYLQQSDGSVRSHQEELFEADRDSEDTACSFFDADGDNWQDLYVCSGGNEYSSSSSALLDRLYINHKGSFAKSPQSLPSRSRFESTSVVAPADFDKDGDTDLFVGVRLIPFSYGLPASGLLLLNDGRGVFSDSTKSLAPSLMHSGLFTDARWSDLDRDGDQDLVVAGEWMPVRVLMNDAGKLTDQTNAWGLGSSSGWYQAIEIADVNKDGYPDMITGNHGLNSRFRASEAKPVRMYVSDFDGNMSVEQVITRYDKGVELPLVLRTDLITQMPTLKKKYLRFGSYVNQSMLDIFGEARMSQAVVLTAGDLVSSVWLNTGKGSFMRKPLPARAQFSPVYALLAGDFSADGNTDILLGGNLYRAKPETGIYDGLYGLLLTGDGMGSFAEVPSHRSGVLVKGEIRALQSWRHAGVQKVMVGKNNAPPELYSYR